VALLALWSVAGGLLARHLAARHDTAVAATLPSVRAIVVATLDEVRREAWLLAQDPAVVEGATRSDWATLAKGAWPRILALTQERIADLLLIVDASGAPLVQVPAARQLLVGTVARPPQATARLAVVDGRAYVLGIAPMPAGMVVVGRRFEALEAAVARLPSRPVLAVVADDRVFGAALPAPPQLDWDAAVRAGRVTIRGEPWLARPLGEADGGLWALVPVLELRGEARRLWLWWAASLVTALTLAVGIAMVSASERGHGATGGGYRTQLAQPIPVNDETWGVMALISQEARTFGADELTLLEAVAHQVGQAVARASLLAESREKSRRLETLARLAQTLNATLSLDEVFRRVVDAAVELFGSSAAQLWLVDDDGQHVSLRAEAGTASPAEGVPLRVGEGLIGTVVATREALAVVDVLGDPRTRNVERIRAEGVVSVGIVPLQLGERVLGTLVIGVRARHEHTSEETQLLTSLASHAANAINNARLYREATRQAQRMSALADLGRLLSETLDLDLVAQRVADSVCQLLGAHSSSLYRLDPRSEALVAFAVSGEAAVALGQNVTFPRGHAVVGLAVQERGPVATSNLLADPRFTFTEEMRARIERAGHRSVLAVPLRVGERVMGALAAADEPGRRFGDDEIRLAEAFADQAALALENARLYTEAMRRRLEAEELARLAQTLTESLDPRAVGDRIVESVLALFQVKSSALR